MYQNYQFGKVATVKKSRSRFNLSKRLFTTLKVGDIVPIYCQEVLPGDTIKLKATNVIRTSSPYIRPVMDNAFIDNYFFFVPNRLTFDKWVNVMGENTESSWANTIDYKVPVTTRAGTVASGSIADYFGLPVGSVPAGINLLPFRAFSLIYNYWFRDQNNINAMHTQTGSAAVSENFNANAFSPNNYFGMPPKAAKLHDYFTSCLPAPQKSENPVELILNFDNIPVVPRDVNNGNYLDGSVLKYQYADAGEVVDNGYLMLSGDNGTLGIRSIGNPEVEMDVVPGNLMAVAENMSSGISVNDLRYAIALQRILERDARCGSRYHSYLQAAFGVHSPDARLQYPEFLGGKRSPLNVQQVAQTSVGTELSALGSVGAYSLSNTDSGFTKSFVEHGFVIGVAVIRQFHTYGQGVDRFWTRRERSDYYDVEFSNIGETPVYQSELFVDSNTLLNDAVFGYQEAWADYKSGVSKITGQMRSNIDNSLDVYHFGDNYANAPTLNEQFINETGVYIDRCLSVSEELQDPFILNTYFEVAAYRVMPTYSIPSLVGHK